MGVTTVSNSLILGGWVTKVLKTGDKIRGAGGGERMGDFFVPLYWIKNAAFLFSFY